MIMVWRAGNSVSLGVAILGVNFGLLCFGILLIYFVLPDSILVTCKPAFCDRKALWIFAGLLTGNAITGIWQFVDSWLRSRSAPSKLLLSVAIIVLGASGLELINASPRNVMHIPWLSWGGVFLNAAYSTISIAQLMRVKRNHKEKVPGVRSNSN